MVMSAREEAAPERGKGGGDASWADTKLTGPKNEENQHGRFICYKWTVKIESSIELIFLKYLQVRSNFVHLIA
jgi:hypothetical protein